MYKVFGFLTKKDGLSMADFIDHYENRHIPLVGGLASPPLVYKRRYIERDRPTTKGATVDFDAMTELVFEDRSAFAAWMATLFGPDSGGVVAEDEERFLDRSKTRGYVVEEYGS